MSVFHDIIRHGETTSVATVVTDSQRSIKYVNDAFTLLCGHEKHEILGRNPGDILQGAETSPETKLEIRRALQKNTPFDAKILNYHKDLHSYITGLYVLPFHDRHTGKHYFLALERELVNWSDELLNDTRFSKTLADFLSILDWDQEFSN